MKLLRKTAYTRKYTLFQLSSCPYILHTSGSGRSTACSHVSDLSSFRSFTVTDSLGLSPNSVLCWCRRSDAMILTFTILIYITKNMLCHQECFKKSSRLPIQVIDRSDPGAIIIILFGMVSGRETICRLWIKACFQSHLPR